jgi:hypothetical protein
VLCKSAAVAAIAVGGLELRPLRPLCRRQLWRQTAGLGKSFTTRMASVPMTRTAGSSGRYGGQKSARLGFGSPSRTKLIQASCIGPVTRSTTSGGIPCTNGAGPHLSMFAKVKGSSMQWVAPSAPPKQRRSHLELVNVRGAGNGTRSGHLQSAAPEEAVGNHLGKHIARARRSSRFRVAVVQGGRAVTASRARPSDDLLPSSPCLLRMQAECEGRLSRGPADHKIDVGVR